MNSFTRRLGGQLFAVIAGVGAGGCAVPASHEENTNSSSEALSVVPAAYDAALKIPRCLGAASGCDTAALTRGRGTMLNGRELNGSNALGGCVDGASGSFHGDESIDRVQVATTDGSALAPGKTVTITADVWAWAASADTAIFYFTADATAANPVWTQVSSQIVRAAGAQRVTANYTLPALPANGSITQAARVQFIYGTSASSACQSGGYNDRDDVAFSVGAPPPPDTIAPVVSISAPAASASLRGSVNVSTNASDNVAVSKVELWLLSASGAATLVGTSTAAPFGVTWDTSSVANGTYTLEARAFDAAGNRGIFDTPVTVANIVKTIAPMIAAHWPASTALVQGGNVLVTGNATSYPWTAATEEYDATTGTFGSASAMGDARSSERLTLLADGRALATGGWGNGSSPTRSLASAELYDGALHHWSYAAPMSTPRYTHTATRLGDGTVLVTGGRSDPSGPSIASAEIYDPASNTWTATTPLPVALTGHSAVLLTGGQVLVMGGMSSIAGGSLSNSTAYLFDPIARTWSANPEPYASGDVVAALPSGDALVVYGTSSRLFKANGTFTAWSTIPVASGWYCMTRAYAMLPSGDVFATGCGPSLSKYTAATNTWSLSTSLAAARTDASLAIVSGSKLLVVGGRTFSCTATGCSQGSLLPSSELVDLTTL